jgi:hypothetical protein
MLGFVLQFFKHKSALLARFFNTLKKMLVLYFKEAHKHDSLSVQFLFWLTHLPQELGSSRG